MPQQTSINLDTKAKGPVTCLGVFTAKMPAESTSEPSTGKPSRSSAKIEGFQSAGMMILSPERSSLLYCLPNP